MKDTETETETEMHTKTEILADDIETESFRSLAITT